MFKRILTATLAAATVFSLASCGDGGVFTRLTPSEDESNLVSGVIYYSEDSASGVVSNSQTELSNDSSTDVSYDAGPVIPESVTASDVDTFFDGSIFVGNSIMLKYERFVNKYRTSSVKSFLGDSKFFCAGSFGVYHNNHTPADSAGAVNPLYQGKKYSVQDMVGVASPKRVLLNLAGLNDMGIYSSAETCASQTADEMIKLIKDITTKYPDVEVVVLSTTYMIKSYNSMSRLNNENLSIMNNLVLDYCNSNGIDFVDISTLLTGDNGCLRDDYCSDPESGGCHLNDSGCLVWTGLLRHYAADKLNGTYKNPQSMPFLSKN